MIRTASSASFMPIPTWAPGCRSGRSPTLQAAPSGAVSHNGGTTSASSASWLDAKRRTAPGFTLIELLAVLAIMAIILSIALTSSMDWNRGPAMRAGVLNVRTALDRARQLAATHGAPAVFVCGMLTNNPGSSPQAYYVITSSVYGAIGTTNYLPLGVAFSNTEPLEILFTPGGSGISLAATGEIDRSALVLTETTRGTNGMAATLTVFRATGLVRIEE